MSGNQPKALVFGATGAIGGAIVDWFQSNAYEVFAVGRRVSVTSSSEVKWVQWSNGQNSEAFSEILIESIDAVVWAQGENFSDDIYTFDISAHRSMYDANVTYILSALQILLMQSLLAPSAKLCVISSIWQNLAKQNKLSYCITKSALSGLVQSLAVDLGRDGYIINAVLPGALDTPMTRANLSESQLKNLEAMTPLGSLSTLDDVCNLVGYLCSQNNNGITGQFIAADKGFSYARII